jgi:hypothetical protein
MAARSNGIANSILLYELAEGNPDCLPSYGAARRG